MTDPERKYRDGQPLSEGEEEVWKQIVECEADLKNEDDLESSRASELFQNLAEFVVGFENKSRPLRSNLDISIYDTNETNRKFVGSIQRQFTDNGVRFVITFVPGFTESEAFKSVYGPEAPNFIRLMVSEDGSDIAPTVEYDTFTGLVVDRDQTKEFERNFVEDLNDNFHLTAGKPTT